VEAVAGVFAGGLIGETDAVKGGEQPVAGAVAGEDATGPVAAVGGRGQTGDQDPWFGRTPTCDRPTSVGLIGERLALA
jgi:hypothetical protein